MMHQIFNQDGFLSRNGLPRHAFEGMTGLAMTVAGLGAFLVVLLRILPVDLFSTALWYDNLNINKVWSADASGFFLRLGNVGDGRVISHEALAMSIFLALTQILLAILFAAAGGWLKNESESSSSVFTVVQRAFTNTPGYGWRDLNWQKINYALALIFLILFDTITDTLWKTGAAPGFGVFIRNFALSFIVNNVFSEWGLFIGMALFFSGLTLLMHSDFIRQLAESVADIAVALFEAVFEVVSKLFGVLVQPVKNARSSGQQSGGANNRNNNRSNKRNNKRNTGGGGGNYTIRQNSSRSEQSRNASNRVPEPIISGGGGDSRNPNSIEELIRRGLSD